jgi:RsiW-degrading membrane proteinase PrsW (M82 family)
MELSDTTAVAVIAFVCFKAIGYAFLVIWLKKREPQIRPHTLLIVGVRVLIGLLTAAILSFFWDAARHRFNGFYNVSYEFLPYYSVLFVLRIFVWAVTLYIFSRNNTLSSKKIWLYALAGSICSSLMDIPAGFLTILVPGALHIC